MEQTTAEAVSFQSKSNPSVRVTLEFAGNGDGTAIEEDITGVLLKKYLGRIRSGEGASYE